MAGVPLPLSMLSHRSAAVTSPAPRYTLVEEGLTGQGRGRCGGEGRGLTGQGIKGQVGRRGKRGAYLARGGVGGEERDEQKMWTCMT